MLVDTWDLPNRHVGRRVAVYDRLDSTNTLALERSQDPASDGLAFLAHEQLAGRGQFGRTWQAPAGSSVLLSVILFPPPSLCRPSLLTAWAAVSVCELIEQITEIKPRIKWPNDVLLQDKKVCGILIERRQSPESMHSALVAGIGLNVRQELSYFEKAQLPLAGSLLSLTGKLWDSAELARELLTRLDRQYTALVQGEITPLESAWRDRLGLIAKDVTITVGDLNHRGKLREIAFAGITLELANGVVHHFQPEAIRQLF